MNANPTSRSRTLPGASAVPASPGGGRARHLGTAGKHRGRPADHRPGTPGRHRRRDDTWQEPVPVLAEAKGKSC